jgi:phosphomannomutase/phosphoglucomutase
MQVNPHIFREYDIRGEVDRDLTDQVASAIGRASGSLFARQNINDAVIGWDCRLSSERFGRLIIDALLQSGINVTDVSFVPTPVLYFSMFHLNTDGGIMITGSHNPKEYNGFKVCVFKQAIYGLEIQKLKSIIEKQAYVSGRGEYKKMDIIPDYIDFVCKNARMGKKKIRAVVDAGNGTGGVVAIPLLRKIGIDVSGLYCDMDGNFPNHHPDPTVKENLSDLVRIVKKKKADVGIAYDGDADRLGIIDEQGSILYGDRILLLLARQVLSEFPRATVISEVKSSKTLFDDIEKHGGRPIMWKVGHSLIKAKMIEEGSPLAGEMSGHIFFKDRYFGYDDAIYSSMRVLEILSSTDYALSDLLKDVPKTFTTPEIRVDCDDSIKFKVVNKAIEFFKKSHSVIEVDGGRILFDNGWWGLVRASNTQPVLVFRFEADSEELLGRIRDDIMEKSSEIIKSMKVM